MSSSTQSPNYISILEKWRNKNSQQDPEFAGWVPCISELRFRYFDPTRQDYYRLSQPRFANFTVAKIQKGRSVPGRHIFSHSFRSLRDHPYNPKNETKYSGEFYFILQASNLPDPKNIYCKDVLAGKMLIINAESERIPEEMKGIYNLGALIHHLHEKHQYVSSGDTNHRELDNLKEKMGKTYGWIADEVNRLKENAVEWVHQETGPVRIMVFDFLLFRNGMAFFRDETDPRIKELLYEKTDDLVNTPPYHICPRSHKMAYYYLKQSFHFHHYHGYKVDSIIGVYNLNRQPGNNFQTFYEHQRNYITEGYLHLKRELKLNRDNPYGYALYLISFFEHLIRARFISDQKYIDSERKLLENFSKTTKEFVEQHRLPNGFLTGLKVETFLLFIIGIGIPTSLLLFPYINQNPKVVYRDILKLFTDQDWKFTVLLIQVVTILSIVRGGLINSIQNIILDPKRKNYFQKKLENYFLNTFQINKKIFSKIKNEIYSHEAEISIETLKSKIDKWKWMKPQQPLRLRLVRWEARNKFRRWVMPILVVSALLLNVFYLLSV